MKHIFLILIIFLMLVNIARAVERINDHCYKFDGVLVCEADDIQNVETLKITIPQVTLQKEDEVIVKTFWTYGNEIENE